MGEGDVLTVLYLYMYIAGNKQGEGGGEGGRRGGREGKRGGMHWVNELAVELISVRGELRSEWLRLTRVYAVSLIIWVVPVGGASYRSVISVGSSSTPGFSRSSKVEVGLS